MALATAINSGSTFLVCNDDATIEPFGNQGLFCADTRFISEWRIFVNGAAPELLRRIDISPRRARWEMIASDLGVGPHGVPTQISVTVDRTMSRSRLHEDICLHVFGELAIDVPLVLQIDSDFADFLEARQAEHQERSITRLWHEPATSDATYSRASFFRRRLTRTGLQSAARPRSDGMEFRVRLQPGERWHVCLIHDLITAHGQVIEPSACPLDTDDDSAGREEQDWAVGRGHLRVANECWQAAIDRALEDLGALRLAPLAAPSAPALPAAGLPWFVAVFGRDSITASLQALAVYPDFARGTLAELGALQATAIDRFRDAEPGKICHEMRHGEWAVFGRIPHHPYYGSADSTTLYLLLLGELYRWTGDADELSTLRATAERCLAWMEDFGDCDGDGFQDYGPRTISGYPNQCWKDSPDGVPNPDGGLPLHPIATAELQAYAYAARVVIADLFAAWGDQAAAASLRAAARELRDRFREKFWLPDEQFTALALDGNKNRVASVASNAGQCLWLGLVDDDQAQLLIDRLMAPDMFSGWGIRTLSSEHRAYDPHSYHRGSVWPHDSMLGAAGMRRYGRDEAAWTVIAGILDATKGFPLRRLPEVFSGIDRSHTPLPIPYRRANAPQAWSAGSVVQAATILMGLDPDAPAGRVYVDPALPVWCPTLAIESVAVGRTRLTVTATRQPDGRSDVDVEVIDGPPLDVIHGRRPEP